MLMRIRTPYGDNFVVDLETGNMTHDKYGQTPHFSGGWKFRGLCHVKRNQMIRLETIKANPAILDTLNIRYKNGHPQYTVADLDYGTSRVWGNTTVHGVASISIVKEST